MKMYKAAHVEQPHPRKNHDRIVIVDNGKVASFAVFDGAGGSEGSERAANVFKRRISGDKPTDLEAAFRAMHGAVARQRHLAKGKAVLRHVRHHEEIGLTRRQAFSQAQGWLVGLTTCAAVRLDLASKPTEWPYSVAGDSSIRVFSRLSGKSEIITNLGHALSNGKTDASDFIGSKSYQGPGRTGTLVLPEDTTIGLFTDGINHWRHGCDYEIDEVLASDESPEIKAKTIAEGTTGADDLAIIIIEHRP